MVRLDIKTFYVTWWCAWTIIIMQVTVSFRVQFIDDFSFAIQTLWESHLCSHPYHNGDRHKILHMARQLCCRAMCKSLWWFEYQELIHNKANFLNDEIGSEMDPNFCKPQWIRCLVFMFYGIYFISILRLQNVICGIKWNESWCLCDSFQMHWCVATNGWKHKQNMAHYRFCAIIRTGSSIRTINRTPTHQKSVTSTSYKHIDQSPLANQTLIGPNKNLFEYGPGYIFFYFCAILFFFFFFFWGGGGGGTF